MGQLEIEQIGKQMKVRTRVAPSPTGDPHVGTAYMALFCRALAHKHGGEFVLRIEDTDAVRSTAESEAVILDSLKYLYNRMCLGAELIHSSPRIMCEISIK
jgi:glutamyl/glutaminyl-tRNA synthetase